MKSMKTLLRVKQREIDALKRQQGIMEKQREDLYKTIDMLADRLMKEMKAAEAMPEMAHFFGDFSAHIKKRQEQIHAHIRRVEAELDKLALVIRDKFSEMKKYELALAAHDKRVADAAKRQDQQAMDELGLRGYIRRDAT
jgi:flagellar biosynthesis chaperone FliJ